MNSWNCRIAFPASTFVGRSRCTPRLLGLGFAASFGALLLGSAALRAQNEVMLNPQELRFSSRADLGDRGGEFLQGFHSSHWRGLGYRGTHAEIRAFRAFSLQDAKRSTPENFRWVVRVGTDVNGPTPGSAGAIFRSSELRLGPVLGGGSQAWDVTTRLVTPVRFDATRFISVGVYVPPTVGASYHADGLTAWIGASLGGSDDNRAARWGADHAWQLIDGQSLATHPSGRRTWRLGFETDVPTLQLGNVVPLDKRYPIRFGSGGLFPDDGQGLAYRVHAAGRDGDYALLFASISPFNIVSVPIFGGRVWLEWHGLLPGVLSASAVQNGTASAVLTSRIPAGMPKQITWQALVLDLGSGAGALSNAVMSSH